MRVLLADDHPTIRLGLMSIISRAFPDTHFVEARNGDEVLLRSSEGRFDLLVLDINMPGRSGLDILHDVKRRWPALPIIVFSVYPEDEYAIRCLRAGAAAYMEKQCGAEVVLTVIQRVLGGGRYVSVHLAEMLAFSLGRSKMGHEGLSDRELEVFRLIAIGKSISEVAEYLHISVKTISTYRSRMMEKMGMRTNAEVTRYALEQKLIA